MKQRITVEQIQELTDEQKERIREWWKPQICDIYVDVNNKKEYGVCNYYHEQLTQRGQRLPLLDIGQMIELLEINNFLQITNTFFMKGWGVVLIDQRTKQGKEFRAEQLCDALWCAVKSIL